MRHHSRQASHITRAALKCGTLSRRPAGAAWRGLATDVPHTSYSELRFCRRKCFLAVGKTNPFFAVRF